MYLRDINLPKADKYGTSQVMAFLQQLLTYQGFYDNKLQFVGETRTLQWQGQGLLMCAVM